MVDEVVEAGQAVLESLIGIFAVQQVSICHFPPGNPENVQFITVGVPSLKAHFAHGDFVAGSASDCPGGDPQDPDDDRKVTICHFPPGNPEKPELISVSVNALPAHVEHGDFLADELSDCDGEPGGEEDKVTICHFPPGNPENVQFISVSVNALPAHFAHGDFLADSEDECLEDDDDDGDDEGDEEGDEDGDDDKAAALPDTGGPSQWSLMMGVLLTLLGMAILSNRESLVRAGLFSLVPVDAPSEPGSPTIGRHVDMAVPDATASHRAVRWTALGAMALVAAAILGRRAAK